VFNNNNIYVDASGGTYLQVEHITHYIIPHANQYGIMVETRVDRRPYGLRLYRAFGLRDRPGHNMFTRKNDGHLPICVRPPHLPRFSMISLTLTENIYLGLFSFICK